MLSGDEWVVLTAAGEVLCLGGGMGKCSVNPQSTKSINLRAACKLPHKETGNKDGVNRPESELDDCFLGVIFGFMVFVKFAKEKKCRVTVGLLYVAARPRHTAPGTWHLPILTIPC